MTVELILFKSDNGLIYLRLLKGFWSICNYQINASWVYGIFEVGLIFGNIFTAVDFFLQHFFYQTVDIFLKHEAFFRKQNQ